MSQAGSINTGGGGGGGIESINTDTGGPVIPVAGVINAFGAGGTVTSGSGNTLTITSSGSSANMIIIYSVVVNFGIAGITNIFTATSDFNIIGVNYASINYSPNVPPGVNVVNFGWTAPDYLDFANTLGSANVMQGTLAINFPPFQSLPPIIPAGITFVINVDTPTDTPATDIQRVDVIGYYA